MPQKLGLDEQVSRDRAGNNIWVCRKCASDSAFMTSARLGLRHGIQIKVQQGRVAQQRQAKLEQIFHRQGQQIQAKADERDRGVLTKATTSFQVFNLDSCITRGLPLWSTMLKLAWGSRPSMKGQKTRSMESYTRLVPPPGIDPR